MGNSADDLLYKKYNEEFVLEEETYNFLELGYHQFIAHPKRFPQLKIYGNRYDEGCSDDYPEQLRAWQCEQFVKEIYQKEHLKNYVNCAFIAYSKHEYGNKILEMENLMIRDSIKIEIYNSIYLFADIDKNNKERMLNEVLELICYYNQFSNKDVSIRVFFWDPVFLQERDFDTLNFTLNVELQNNANDDNDYNKDTYIKHTLNIRFQTPVKIKFNIDTLFNAVKPYDRYAFVNTEPVTFK